MGAALSAAIAIDSGCDSAEIWPDRGHNHGRNYDCDFDQFRSKFSHDLAGANPPRFTGPPRTVTMPLAATVVVVEIHRRQWRNYNPMGW